VAAKFIKNSEQDDAQGCASVAGGRMPGATVRDYAAKQGISAEEALKEGMKTKAVEFVAKGGKIYDEV